MRPTRLGGALRRRARPRRRFGVPDRVRPGRGAVVAAVVAPLVLARLRPRTGR